MRTTAAADSDGDRPPAPRDEGLLRVGDVVDGRYQLHDKLGTGGTGVVWRARHLQMQGPVALKILLPRLRVREQAVGRFWREARLMGELGHPNIVRVLDVSPPDAPIPYMAMELLEGGSLYQRIEEQGRVPLDEACRLLDGVLSALVAAHRRGIVHRDIKPENLMFATVRDIISDEPRTELKVLDFGASILLAEAGADELGSLAGTPFYMSPEQASGSVALDHRSDLYSVAVVLYELLSGHHPHTGENVHGILFSIASEPATPIETHRPDLPAEVFGFFATALAQDPEHRFQTGDEMRLALRGLSSELAALDRHTQLFLEAVHDDVPVSVSRGSSGVVVRRSSGVYPRAGSGPHARAGTGSYPRTGSGVYPRAGTGSYPRAGSGVHPRPTTGSYARVGSGVHPRPATGSYPRAGSGVHPRPTTAAHPRVGSGPQPRAVGRSGPQPRAPAGPITGARSGPHAAAGRERAGAGAGVSQVQETLRSPGPGLLELLVGGALVGLFPGLAVQQWRHAQGARSGEMWGDALVVWLATTVVATALAWALVRRRRGLTGRRSTS